MPKGYYEHEIEVRFTEGIMSSSSEWQWFVDYTEEHFDPKVKLDNICEFNNCYLSIYYVYTHFSKLTESNKDLCIEISAPWLKRLYECARVKAGNLELEAAIKNDGFFDVLAIASYSTLLMNRIGSSKYLFNPQLLFTSNLHELYDFDSFDDQKDYLLEIVNSISIKDFDKVVRTLEDNFSSRNSPVDHEYISALLDNYFHADFLSFQNIKPREFQTWQEALLCDIFKTSCNSGTIEPAVQYGDGTESPALSFWTEEILNKAKASFDDPRAICVIETIEFLQHDIDPSEESKETLISLCLDHVQGSMNKKQSLRTIVCTAFHVTQLLHEHKLLNENQRNRYFKGMHDSFKEVSDPKSIEFMLEHSIPCTKSQRNLYSKWIQNLAKESLKAVSSPHGLLMIFQNPQIARTCDSDDIELSFRLFLQLVDEGDVLAAELFYWALQFYVEAMGNPSVDNNTIKGLLINLMHSWKDKYYKTVVSNMKVFTQKGSIATETVNQLNEDFLARPHSVAHATILQSDNAIVDILEDMAEHAILHLFSHTTISEYYPDHIHIDFDNNSHPIDCLIANEIIRVYKEKSYRFLNQLPEQEYIDGFYDEMNQRIKFMTSLIDIEPVYKWIAENIILSYELLPFPDKKPTLGHVTQLFPMLENVIRSIGEFFNIVPFQIDKTNFTRLRDVSGIIFEMVKELESITNTVQGSNEFLFVYHVMYSPNGFNIRNDCVHGRRYQGSVGILEAFRLTVICTYMMLKRLRGLEMVQDEENS